MVLRNTEVKDLTFLMAELRHMIMKLDYHSVYQYIHTYLIFDDIYWKRWW